MKESLRSHWERSAGGYGWCAVALGVAALDIALPQTLSSYADRMLENRSTRAIPWAIGGIVAGHVLNVIPHNLDPIQRMGDAVARRYPLVDNKNRRAR